MGVVCRFAALSGLLLFGTFAHVWAAPSLLAALPDYGSGGDLIRLEGRDFGSQPGCVFFGLVPAEILAWQNQSIELRVPEAAPAGPTLLRVIAGDLSQPVPFVVTPRIKGVIPHEDGEGRILILGMGFGLAITTSRVYVGTATATVAEWTPNWISAFLPPQGAGLLFLTVRGTFSNALPYHSGVFHGDLLPNQSPPE